ncbi:acetyltransferase [Meira miltonrushii]|uniref:Acetyltransferase n=1 Tax=Meira miltonrushii TaxID=1280837 RepID=A0A316VFI1_9BASI|nr:acetyltransferase [Meira miltonrushii]PWN36342.1 acetyltransferase [Meira miltonrushii]
MSVPEEQPVGPLVESKTVGKAPERIEGRYVTLEHLSEKYVGPIWQKIKNDPQLWTYMLEGPFADQSAFLEAMKKKWATDDPYTYAIIDVKTGEALGYLALMRWDKPHRAIEIGHVMFSKSIQRTKGATEAFYLAMTAVFGDSLNTRRLEWKCNALNAPSKRAAERLGYTFEGVFRNHYIVKGRSRDSAWFSILETEWPVIQKAFQQWLHPDNFDQNGQQKRGLVDIRQTLVGEQK